MQNTHIIEQFIETDKIDKDITIACCSDLHLWKKEMLGKENVAKLIKTLDNVHFDYLLIPGDLINDSNDLKDENFRKEFLKIIKKLTHGKITFYTLGNHDLMTMGLNGWEAGDATLLKETLKELNNVIYLENLNSLSLNIDTLETLGYPTANINIIGAHLPFEFYDKEAKESNESFVKYWNEINSIQTNPCRANHYNILLLHALRNFVNESKYQENSLLPGLDLAVGGHYHNGTIPNYLLNLIPGHRGILNPQMELLPNNNRGIVEVNNTKFYLGGYTNFRVETTIANKLFGGPCLLLLHLSPKTKENTNNQAKSRVLSR